MKKPKTEIKFNDGLPSAPSSQATAPEQLSILMVAPPGWGKTELFTSCPDSILLAAEEGHRFVSCHKIIIDDWDESEEKTDQNGNLHLSFLDAIARLQATERFSFVIIDTVDALVKKCVEYHIPRVSSRSKNFSGDPEHISDLGDFGKGYDLAMNNPLRVAFGEILSTGRGLGFITHQELKTYDIKGNVKPVRKETTLPNGVIKFLFPQCDLILHGEFGASNDKGINDRIIRTQGTEEMLAKNRGGILPPAYVVDPNIKNRWSQFQSFFDPSTGRKVERKPTNSSKKPMKKSK